MLPVQPMSDGFHSVNVVYYPVSILNGKIKFVIVYI